MRLTVACLIAALGVSDPLVLGCAGLGQSGEMMSMILRRVPSGGRHRRAGRISEACRPRRQDRVRSARPAFLAQLVLTGMSGTISVDGRQILGIMPGFDSLKDDELASVLNYVVRLEGAKAPPSRRRFLRQARAGAKADARTDGRDQEQPGRGSRHSVTDARQRPGGESHHPRSQQGRDGNETDSAHQGEWPCA